MTAKFCKLCCFELLDLSRFLPNEFCSCNIISDNVSGKLGQVHCVTCTFCFFKFLLLTRYSLFLIYLLVLFSINLTTAFYILPENLIKSHDTFLNQSTICYATWIDFKPFVDHGKHEIQAGTVWSFSLH